jgi:hypothetical protein
MPGRTRSKVVASLVAVTAALCAWSAPAGAATVVVGDPMVLGHDSSYFSSGATATVANTALSESGAHVTSPVNGTIVSWRVITTGTGEYALRVLRPGTAGEYTGAGRSPQTVTVAGDQTFSANLPIQTGDLVGVDIPDFSIDGSGISGHSLAAVGGVFSTWVPALAEGAAEAPGDSFTNQEMAINATVEYTETPGGPGTGGGGPGTTPPSKKKCKKKKKHKSSAQSAKKKCKKKKKR